MKHSALIRLLGAAILAVSACGKPKESPSDAAAPAVVKAPPPIIPSDTAKLDTLAQHKMRMQALSEQVAPQYGFIHAGISFHDRKLLEGIYAPTAVLVFADTTYSGAQSISAGLIETGRRISMVDWQRNSKSFTGQPDSIYVDSGTYVITAGRKGGPTHEQKGTYVAKWRHLGGPEPWVLLRDEIIPAGQAAKRAKAPPSAGAKVPPKP